MTDPQSPSLRTPHDDSESARESQSITDKPMKLDELADRVRDLLCSVHNVRAESERYTEQHPQQYSHARAVDRLRSYVHGLIEEAGDFMQDLSHALATAQQPLGLELYALCEEVFDAYGQLDPVHDKLKDPAHGLANEQAESNDKSATQHSAPFKQLPDIPSEPSPPSQLQGVSSENLYARTRPDQRLAAFVLERQGHTDQPRSSTFCPICAEDKPVTQFTIERCSKDCVHKLECCADCVQAWVRSSLEDNNWQHATCVQCSEQLAYEDLQKLTNSQTFARYDNLLTRRVIGQDPDFQWCRDPACSSGHVHNDEAGQPLFECSDCAHRFCLRHDVPWHEDQTCEEYDHDAGWQRRNAQRRSQNRASDETVRRTSKTCPNSQCGCQIQKRDGCDHMTCSRCRTEFCWQCLANYRNVITEGPRGHGRGCPHWRDSALPTAFDGFNPMLHALQENVIGGRIGGRLRKLQVITARNGGGPTQPRPPPVGHSNILRPPAVRPSPTAPGTIPPRAKDRINRTLPAPFPIGRMPWPGTMFPGEVPRTSQPSGRPNSNAGLHPRPQQSLQEQRRLQRIAAIRDRPDGTGRPRRTYPLRPNAPSHLDPGPGSDRRRISGVTGDSQRPICHSGGAHGGGSSALQKERPGVVRAHNRLFGSKPARLQDTRRGRNRAIVSRPSWSALDSGYSAPARST